MDHYNNVRLNSATGYITPKDMLAGRQQEIQAERDRKLEQARKTADSSPASRLMFSPRALGEILLAKVHANARRHAGVEAQLPDSRPTGRSET